MHIKESKELFDDLLLVGDVVQWTAMLLGYIEHDKNEDAIQLYLQMLVQGLLPNMMSFFGMLTTWEQLSYSNVLVQHGGNITKCSY